MAVNSRRGLVSSSTSIRLLRARRGFVFTTFAIIIVAIVIMLALASDKTLDRTVAQTDRVHTMDGYAKNLEADLPRAAYIAAFRGLIALEQDISERGEYLANFDGSFQEVFTNGTVNGTPYSIMDDSTFTDFTTRFQTLAATQGMRANLTVLSINTSQDEPWTILVDVSIRLELADLARTASFNRTIIVRARVPIADVKDPIYSVGTQGRAPNAIKQSAVMHPYISATNDTSNLQTLVNSSLYTSSTRAPSFIMRFSGNFSPSPYGIESLVNIKTLRAQALAISCRSTVDYLYFGNGTVVTNDIVNMDSANFWLDDASLADYDAVSKTVGSHVCS